MALLQIGASGGGIMNALANNSIASALGISQGSISPSTFATKFGAQSLFTASSLPYIIRTNKNFDIIFHWHPKRSQIRSYFANAFSASDTDELNLFVRKVNINPLVNQAMTKADAGARFAAAIPGNGVGSSSQATAFSLDILSTEFSLVNHCFYQWMRETESTYWIYGPTGRNDQNGIGGGSLKQYSKMMVSVFGSYVDAKSGDTVANEKGFGYHTVLTTGGVVGNGQDPSRLIALQSETQMVPFTRADVEVKYYSGNQTALHSVTFYGAFPVRLEMMSADHEGNFKEFYRVDFACDSIDISSPFVAEADENNKESWASQFSDKVSEVGFLANNTAKWTVGLQENILSNLGNVWLAKASRMLNKTTNKAGAKVNDALLKAQKALGA